MFDLSNARQCGDVLVDGNDKLFWFAQSLVLCRVKTPLKDFRTGKFAFVRYFKLTLPIENVDHMLNFLRLRWARDVEVDYSFRE